MVPHQQEQPQKRRFEFEEDIEIIRALLVERRYSHATRKARELVQNQEAPQDVRHRARWYLLLASLGAQLKEHPCFHDQLWLDLRRSVDQHSSTPDQLAHHFQPLWDRWHSCLRHSEAARALHTILQAHRQVHRHRQALHQALLTATDHSAAPWLKRAQDYLDALRRCLDDLEPLRQELDQWLQHDYVFPDDEPLAFSQELSQKLQATSQAIEQLQELQKELHQAAHEARQRQDALHALDQELSALLPTSTTDPSLLPQLDDWLQRYRDAFHALEQAATRAQELDRAHHALHQAPPPVSSWAREVLSLSPSSHIPSLDDLRPRRHLLDLLDRLHHKIQTADFHAVSEEVVQYPHPLPQSAPLKHLLDWYRDAARLGLRFLDRFEDELHRAEQALDAWNLHDAHRQLQQLQQLRTQPTWPLPHLLLQRLDALRTRCQRQHDLERSVQDSLDQGHYLAVLTRLPSPQDDRQHAWLREAQAQQAFFQLVDDIRAGLTSTPPPSPHQAQEYAAQTNQLITQAQALTRPAVRRALEELLNRHWTHWLHHNDSFEALQAAVHTLNFPSTDALATDAFAQALTSARQEIHTLAEIEAALSQAQKDADWFTWNQWQAQLHRLEQHALCAASRKHARVVRRRLDQAVQHALRQHALQIQRLLQEAQPQEAYRRATSVWAEITQGVTDQHHFLQQLQQPELPGWSQDVTQAIRDLKALRDFLRWTTTIEAQEQRVRDAITSNTPLDTIIQALDRLERRWHQAPPDSPHTPGPHYHALAARRREWRLIKRALDPLRELHRTRSRLDPVEERLRASHDPLRQLADAIEQHRLEAHHTRDLFDTHLLPRAIDHVRQIIDDVRQAWQAAEHNIASGTPTQVLHGWTTLISLWQWSPRLAALCDALDIPTGLPRPDAWAQRARTQAHAYLKRLPERVFATSDQQNLSQLLDELDQVRLAVAGVPDAAQLPLPATATTLLDALTMAHSTLRRLLSPPYEPTSLHTYLSAVEEDFKALEWHDESFAQTLNALRRVVDEVISALPPSPTPPHDDDDTSLTSLLDRLIALERNPLIQRHRSRTPSPQNQSPFQQLLLYGTADSPPPDHLPLAWWFDALAKPLLSEIRSLAHVYKDVQFRVREAIRDILADLPNRERETVQLLTQVFWIHLMEDNQTTSSPFVAVAQTLSHFIEKSIAELDVNDKTKVLKSLIKATSYRHK